MGYALAMAMRKPTRGRKLLIASVGVATINYVAACGGETSGGADGGQAGATHSTGGYTSGNLVAPPPAGAGGTVAGGGYTSGNLVAPPPAGAGGTVAGGGYTSGNLV